MMYLTTLRAKCVGHGHITVLVTEYYLLVPCLFTPPPFVQLGYSDLPFIDIEILLYVSVI